MKIREMLTVWGYEVNTEELEKAEKKLQGIQKQSKKVFMASSAVMAGMIGSASVVYDNITDALTITNKAGQEFTNTQEEMLDKTLLLSQKLNIFANNVSEAYYGAISTGAEIGSEKFNKITETALKFGKLIKMDTAQAITTLADTTNGLGYELTEVDKVANSLFVTSKQANTDVPLLAEAMKDAGSITQAMGRDLSETTAILATYAETGIKGGQAGTAFRNSMLKIIAPSSKGAKVLKKLGVSADDGNGKVRNFIDILSDLQVAMAGYSDVEKIGMIKDLVETENLTNFQKLMGANLDKTRAWADEVKRSGNAVDEGFDKKMNSPIEQLKLFLNGIVNIGIAIGRHFIPPMVFALKIINKFVGAIVEFLTTYKIFAMLLAIITASIVAVSGLTFAYASLRLALLATSNAYKLLGITSFRATAKMLVVSTVTKAWAILSKTIVGAIRLVILFRRTSIRMLILQKTIDLIRWAVVKLKLAFVALGNMATLANLKMAMIGILVLTAITIIILALQDLYGFLTGEYDSVLQHVVDNWDAVWGENLTTTEKFLKGVGDILIGALKGWQLLIQNFGEILNSPWTAMYAVATTILLEVYKFFLGVMDKIAMGYNKIAQKIPFVDSVSDEALKKQLDADTKKQVEDLEKYFNDNMAEIAMLESAKSSANNYAVAGSAQKTSNIQNTSTSSQQVQITIDGSKDPKETGREVQRAMKELHSKSSSDFKTRVAY